MFRFRLSLLPMADGVANIELRGPVFRFPHGLGVQQGRERVAENAALQARRAALYFMAHFPSGRSLGGRDVDANLWDQGKAGENADPTGGRAQNDGSSLPKEEPLSYEVPSERLSNPQAMLRGSQWDPGRRNTPVRPAKWWEQAIGHQSQWGTDMAALNTITFENEIIMANKCPL